MKVALLTFCTDDRFHRILDMVYPNRDAYCKRHNYTHIVYEGDYYNPDWYYAIQRLQYVLDFFDTADLWWIFNVAGVITNSYIPIVKYDKGNVTIQRDRNGLNAGSFLIHTNERTKAWLVEVIRLALTVNHPWHEQKVIQDLELDPKWSNVYSIPEGQAFNQYMHVEYNWPQDELRDWKVGDFAVTFPGLPIERREELIRYTIGIRRYELL